MVKKKLAFVFGVFCATVLLMAVQKPVFLAYYAADAAQASAGEWLGVVWHGLTLDSTVAGYVTALPLLLTLASLWVRLPERIWRRVLNVYFVLIAVLTAAVVKERKIDPKADMQDILWTLAGGGMVWLAILAAIIFG